MFGFIKKVFIGLLATIVNASYDKKCVPLNNQQCITHPTLLNLNPNEYPQGLH